MNPLSAVFDGEPIHIALATPRTNRPFETWRPVAARRPAIIRNDPPRRATGTTGRIGGDGDLLAPEPNDDQVGEEAATGAIRSDRRMTLLPSGQAIR